HFSLSASLYFSTETYTSFGYGDVIPSGDLRMVAGVEALNGLLLIGWSASYTYIAMVRFWSDGDSQNVVAATQPGAVTDVPPSARR
ncbi:MAG: potassium channel family protein, partial [Pyrinomonadaceae bacterium]